jgi:hypothetical protein
MKKKVEEAYKVLLKLRQELSIEDIVPMLPILGIDIELLDEILVSKETSK